MGWASILNVAHVFQGFFNVGREFLVDEFAQAALVTVLGESGSGDRWCGHLRRRGMVEVECSPCRQSIERSRHFGTEKAEIPREKVARVPAPFVLANTRLSRLLVTYDAGQGTLCSSLATTNRSTY